MPNRVSCSLGEPDPEAPGGLSVFQLLSSGRWVLTQWGLLLRAFARAMPSAWFVLTHPTALSSRSSSLFRRLPFLTPPTARTT